MGYQITETIQRIERDLSDCGARSALVYERLEVVYWSKLLVVRRPQ